MISTGHASLSPGAAEHSVLAHATDQASSAFTDGPSLCAFRVRIGVVNLVTSRSPFVLELFPRALATSGASVLADQSSTASSSEVDRVLAFVLFVVVLTEAIGYLVFLGIARRVTATTGRLLARFTTKELGEMTLSALD